MRYKVVSIPWAADGTHELDWDAEVATTVKEQSTLVNCGAPEDEDDPMTEAPAASAAPESVATAGGAALGDDAPAVRELVEQTSPDSLPEAQPPIVWNGVERHLEDEPSIREARRSLEQSGIALGSTPFYPSFYPSFRRRNGPSWTRRQYSPRVL